MQLVEPIESYAVTVGNQQACTLRTNRTVRPIRPASSRASFPDGRLPHDQPPTFAGSTSSITSWQNEAKPIPAPSPSERTRLSYAAVPGRGSPASGPGGGGSSPCRCALLRAGRWAGAPITAYRSGSGRFSGKTALHRGEGQLEHGVVLLVDDRGRPWLDGGEEYTGLAQERAGLVRPRLVTAAIESDGAVRKLDVNGRAGEIGLEEGDGALDAGQGSGG